VPSFNCCITAIPKMWRVNDPGVRLAETIFIPKIPFCFTDRDFADLENQTRKHFDVMEDLVADCLWEGLLSPGIGKRYATRQDLFLRTCLGCRPMVIRGFHDSYSVKWRFNGDATGSQKCFRVVSAGANPHAGRYGQDPPSRGSYPDSEPRLRGSLGECHEKYVSSSANVP
jgi:hypothetical protein